MNFYHQHALITGGSSGIGKAAAILLAKAGANISIIARGRDQLETAKTEIADAQTTRQQVVTISADVASQAQAEQAIADAIAHLGPPHLLITSAGIAHPGHFQNLPIAVFEQTMAVNYFGSLYCIKAALPTMMQHHQGHIVLISSGAGLLGLYGYTAYSPSKFAVRGLAESLRGELKSTGIHLSIVYPPDTDTPQLAAENQTKPAETQAITATAETWSAREVAQVILEGVQRRSFVITPGLEMSLLAKLHSILLPLLNRYCDHIVTQVQTGRNNGDCT